MTVCKKLLSLFLVAQIFVFSPLGCNVTNAQSHITMEKRTTLRRKSTPITQKISVTKVKPKSTAHLPNSGITKLRDQELQKCEFTGVDKKDWAQRLQWFESKIINHYKGLDKKNILVVGPQKFLDAFKVATQKHNWNANFTYATKANSQEIAGEREDLVIDAQYDPQHFKEIYGKLNISSFRDVYAEILYDEALTFLEKNGVKYYFFEVPILNKIKNLDEFEKRVINGQASQEEIIALLRN